MEMNVKDDVEKVIHVIVESAKIGKIGDGKIFVSNVEKNSKE